jgi:hypothetical protein
MYTNKELADKIGWAGSIEKVLEDGVQADEIEDVKISGLWQDIEFSWETFQESVDALDQALEEYYEPFKGGKRIG